MITAAAAPPSRASIEAAIRRTIAKRKRRLEAVAEVDAELRGWVQQGFAQGLSGPDLAKAADVSVPRIYQIRDGRRGGPKRDGD